MVMDVRVFPYRGDNYGFLAHHDGATLAVDAGDSASYLAALDGGRLDHIVLTHHHSDHTSHLQELRAATGAKVWGPPGIDGVDQVLADGDMAPLSLRVIATPGHTLDMLTYVGHGVAFTGDTLFTLGCGRLFEGTAEMMWESLQKLAALPEETLVYGAHEYTLANLDFALAHVSGNEALQNRAQILRALRADAKPTVPSTIGAERATNPFLLAKDAQDFARIRKAKDSF